MHHCILPSPRPSEHKTPDLAHQAPAEPKAVTGQGGFLRGLVARVEPAVDAALIGRYYESFADHAVSIAHQVSFLVTAQPA
jgi:phosphate uptake regulator